MISLAESAGNDNALVWLFDIETDTETIKLSYPVAWSTEGDVYQAGFIMDDDFQEMVQTMEFNSDNRIQNQFLCSLSIPNWSGLSFKDFQPSSAKDYLINRKVKISFTWTGSESKNNLYDLYISYYSYAPNKLVLELKEYYKLNSVIPFYNVQNSIDDSVSYYPSAPEESIDKTIPIVYGYFKIGAYDEGKIGHPIIMIEKDKYLIASHPVAYEIEGAEYYYLYEQIIGCDYKMLIRPYEVEDRLAGNIYEYLGLETLYCDCLLTPMKIGKNDDTFSVRVEDIQLPEDGDYTQKITIPVGKTVYVQYKLFTKELQDIGAYENGVSACNLSFIGNSVTGTGEVTIHIYNDTGGDLIAPANTVKSLTTSPTTFVIPVVVSSSTNIQYMTTRTVKMQNTGAVDIEIAVVYIELLDWQKVLIETFMKYTRTIESLMTRYFI